MTPNNSNLQGKLKVFKLSGVRFIMVKLVRKWPEGKTNSLRVSRKFNTSYWESTSIIVLYNLMFTQFIVIELCCRHSFYKTSVSRAVQLIPNCTLKEYLLGFYGNDDFRRSSEDFRRVQNSPKGIRRFPKMTRTLPKISEDDRTLPKISEDAPKSSEDFRTWSEGQQIFPIVSRRLAKTTDVFIALILPFMLLTSDHMISCQILSFLKLECKELFVCYMLTMHDAAGETRKNI